MEVATFGSRLRHYRERAGLSQEALAERAGLAASAIAALERGRRQHPRAHTVRQLADALGLAGEERTALLAVARATPASESVVSATPADRDRRLPSLPIPATNLIGRESELAAATLLLAGGVRLLTLTGPGGAGKTRLALAVAAGLVANYPDGVAFVDLAPLRDARLVPAAIARILGIGEAGGRSARELLLAHLRGRCSLLVLDNFEHLLAIAPLLTELLDGCPRLAVLVTSRAALRLRGERRFPVAPLAAPPAGPLSMEAIAAAPAVSLFVERARAVAPDFTLTPATACTVAAICRRLDGLPLAIELAATWVELLGPRTLLQRLERRLPLLSGGATDLPERQQAMRQTIAWSYDLLGPTEQTLFRRLGVFNGGWTLEAAEAVCRGGALLGDANAVLEALRGLVDNSLVRRVGGGETTPCFEMLETVHEYASEQLAASGEQLSIQRAHAEFMLQLARSAQRELTGPAQAQWVQRLEQELHNLRAALGWALDGGDSELAMRLCAALSGFWYNRGYYGEGRTWCLRALATAPGATPGARARVLFAAASLADIQHDYAEARSLIEQSVALSRTAGDRRWLAQSLAEMGMIARHQQDWEAARRSCEEALALYAEHPEPWGQRLALGVLGWVAEDQGDHVTARRLLEASLTAAQASGSPIDITLQLNNLGIVALREGDVIEAVARHRAALRLTREVDAREPMACALEGLAAVASAGGDQGRAAWLLGAAGQLRAVIGSPRIAQFEDEYRRVHPRVLEALGEDAYMAAATAGAAAPLPEVLAAAADDDRPTTRTVSVIGSSGPLDGSRRTI